MVEKFKKILAEIRNTRGEVSIFGILRIDDVTDKWNIIISAPWLENIHTAERDDVLQYYKYLVETCKKHLTQEELAQINSLGIFKKDEHLIQELLQFQADSYLENIKVNGNFIHEGYLLASNSSAT